MNGKDESKKYYTVYQITNILNDKIYIGFHSTNNLNDSYMGSGKAMQAAYKKYGKDKFAKKYIAIFDNKEDAELLESQIVNLDFINRKDTYNMSIGGNVCILYGESNGFFGKKHSKETLLKIRESLKDYKHTEETKEKISKTSLKMWSERDDLKEALSLRLLGSSHSEETKKKISDAHKGQLS